MSYEISMIGSGNVAWHLAMTLDNAGYPVKEVYSRNFRNAEALVDRLYGAEPKSDLDFSNSPSQLFIISVSDDAIKEIVREIILPEEAILVHTSGTKPLNAMEFAATKHVGVFYPLQTFSKSRRIEFSEVPLCLEAADGYTKRVLKEIANNISKHVAMIDSANRAILHIAAVFACNFTNHLFKIAEDILDEHKLKFDLLKPLIVETVNKSLEMGASISQTGPAVRQDFEVLDKHMEKLEYNEEYAEIYRLLSQNIIDTYGESEE
ncbi:DUF2520 domain-containing protein [Fulvivirgaceae bacterium BMA10]|uniref:DUF2520 domain-containing protein n=2 Tax=Splendidivirga corallicola TaxID=3051826 RepID=A0ABT8KRW5_9BACT|nr:DUF2520 domain-containing protein [Fulvivirgaceae bacterium BMA10]